MSNEHLFAQKLSKTVIDGRLDAALIEDLETLETVDEESSGADLKARTDVSIEIESIISKLDGDNSGLELNRYELESLRESVNNDEYVLLVKDVNLDRIVEAHVLDQDAAGGSEHNSELIHEALILGSLDHPGIPPIYDLNISSNHLVYCTLKHIDGFPLSSLCVKHLDGADDQLLVQDTVAEIVGNFIKIAEIINYAHSCHVIHRNIKPENLLIGNFGQVYVTAWGNAFDAAKDEPDFSTLRGTPLYMSPEQASCAALDVRSDIYNFGASLFHVLLKRPPLAGDSLEDFWQKKKQGVLDPYQAGTDRPIDKPLLAICMRCLQADPADRYQSMAELIEDLKHYQNGQMVEVHKYGIVELMSYWSKSNKMHLKWALATLLLFAIAAFVFQVLKEREASGWGKPIYEEGFDQGDQWREKWMVRRDNGELLVKDGQLVTKSGPEFIWYFSERLHGGVAIEFEGEMLPGAIPGDLSIVYSQDIENVENGGRGQHVYYLQHGAVNNACSMIAGPVGRLDYADKELERGVRYHVRGEVNGKELRLYLNGELTCTYDLLFPLNSGYIGLYAYYEGKVIDNIKIYNRQLPQVTNIIKTGDLLFENDLYDLAMERYQKISEQYGDSEIGQEGQYKYGLCLYKKGEIEQAFKVWDAMNKTVFAMQINFYRWEQLVAKSDYNELLRQMYAMYRSSNPRVQTQIREQWGLYLYRVRALGDDDLVREFLRFRDVSFPNDQIFSLETYYAYRSLGHPEKALELFPSQDNTVARALLEMGEYQRVVDEYPDMHSSVATALRHMGQQQRVIDEFSDLKGGVISTMMDLGQFEEVLERYADVPGVIPRVLLAQGKYDQVIEQFKDTNYEQQARFRKGDTAAILDGSEDAPRSITGYDAQMSLWLASYINGDETVLAHMYNSRSTLTYWQKWNDTTIFLVDLLPDVLLCMDGNREPLQKTLDGIWEQKLRIMGMRHWHNVGLLLGHLTEQEYRAQPDQRHLDDDYLFYAGLRQDLFGDKQQAQTLYQQFKELAVYKKRFCLSREQLVEHRLQKLAD